MGRAGSQGGVPARGATRGRRGQTGLFTLSDGFVSTVIWEEFLDLVEHHVDVLFANEVVSPRCTRLASSTTVPQRVQHHCEIAALTLERERLAHRHPRTRTSSTRTDRAGGRHDGCRRPVCVGLPVRPPHGYAARPAACAWLMAARVPSHGGTKRRATRHSTATGVSRGEDRPRRPPWSTLVSVRSRRAGGRHRRVGRSGDVRQAAWLRGMPVWACRRRHRSADCASTSRRSWSTGATRP